MLFTSGMKKNGHFRAVYGKGKSVANRNLVMFLCKNNGNRNFLGISVSKKIGKSVTRNRVKRLIKESYRGMEPYIKKGYDIIIVARIPVSGTSFDEVMSSVKHLFQKQGVYCDTPCKKA